MSILMIAGAQAQDGARAYFPVPAGTNDIEFTGDFVHTEFGGSVVDSMVFTPSYRHTFDVMGDAGTFLIGLPLGDVSGSINTGFGTVTSSDGPAQGDLFVGGTIGLVGAPALSPMQYAQFQPGLIIDFTGRLFLPTGDYNSNRLLNLGGNRASFYAALPITYVLGGSLVDPQLTTIEITPSVQIFGNNTNSPGSHAVTSQNPLFGVEAHVTHGFSPMVWGSLDAFAQSGGETTTAGHANGDAQQSLALGATLGLNLSQSVAMRLSYQQQVYSQTPGTANRTFMATTAFLF